MRFIVLIAALTILIQMYNCQSCTCTNTTLIPHGASEGDTFIKGDDVSTGTPVAAVSFVYYGISYYKAYINTNGVITFVTGVNGRIFDCGYPNTNVVTRPVLLIYSSDLDNRLLGNVSFRIDNNTDLLTSIDNIIQGCIGDVLFTSRVSLVATWYMIQKYNRQAGTEFTFQATLATNGTETYMITSYENLTNSGAGIGGQNRDGTKGFNHPLSCHDNTADILTSSNYGCPGNYIVKISDEPAYGFFNNGAPVCLSNPCENGATCEDNKLAYSCICADGFDGHHCENDINECLIDQCENNALCIDAVNNYTCLCVDGYVGRHCEIDIDECILGRCRNSARCVDGVNTYACICEDGYGGRDCEIDIEDCLLDSCRNNARCIDGVDTFTCICADGYEGVNCELDIDDCLDHSCDNNSTCVDAVNNYTCLCESGYTGWNCDIDINDCLLVPCENNALCVDALNNYTCSCGDGYEGRHCEIDINDCMMNSCENSGVCIDAVNNYTCSCGDGYEGRHCEIVPDTTTHIPSAAKVEGKEKGLLSSPLTMGLTAGLLVMVILCITVVIIVVTRRRKRGHGKESTGGTSDIIKRSTKKRNKRLTPSNDQELNEDNIVPNSRADSVGNSGIYEVIEDPTYINVDSTGTTTKENIQDKVKITNASGDNDREQRYKLVIGAKTLDMKDALYVNVDSTGIQQGDISNDIAANDREQRYKQVKGIKTFVKARTQKLGHNQNLPTVDSKLTAAGTRGGNIYENVNIPSHYQNCFHRESIRVVMNPKRRY